MPRGISVVFPPSRCPSCNTRLAWRDNIPIFGWIFLGGRCRYCKSKISPEYPIVETAVALLFALFYVVWYMIPPGSTWLGIHWDVVRPYWTRNDPAQTWPTFMVLLTLLGSLVAMTIVDAKTFTIPLSIMWVPAIVAVLVHPLHAAMVGRLPYTAKDWVWAIPTPDPSNWPAILATLGAVLGLGVANLLLRAGLIRPSFADYADWEKAHLAQSELAAVTSDKSAPAETTAHPAGGDPGLWMQYPHARREMIKELAFLAPCGVLGLAGWYLGKPGTLSILSHAAPLWLTVLSGVFLGYLVGGGVVWAVRILGSLGFGKEAMGLGDVHLMAAVGAAVGCINSTLAFFGAAFVGLAWAILGRLFSGFFQRMMPYGPFLAVATVLVLLLKRPIELGLGALLHQPVSLPP
jgi:leader peptidase (prepilin peptidase)/N-methyltransferase